MPNPGDATIRDILTRTRTVAVVGWSPNPARPSHGVAAWLKRRGMRVIPVNPGHAGRLHEGEMIRARLADIPKDAGVEMVDIFRRVDAIAGVVDEALAELPGLKVVWMQLGIADEDAAEKARARGVTVVQDTCPKIEAGRLGL